MTAYSIVRGKLGWRNAENSIVGNFDTYGPDGRWGNGRRGQALADALREADCVEGDQLIVISLDRFADADVVEAGITAFLESNPPIDVRDMP